MDWYRRLALCDIIFSCDLPQQNVHDANKDCDAIPVPHSNCCRDARIIILGIPISGGVALLYELESGESTAN